MNGKIARTLIRPSLFSTLIRPQNRRHYSVLKQYLASHSTQSQRHMSSRQQRPDGDDLANDTDPKDESEPDAMVPRAPALGLREQVRNNQTVQTRNFSFTDNQLDSIADAIEDSIADDSIANANEDLRKQKEQWDNNARLRRRQLIKGFVKKTLERCTLEVCGAAGAIWGSSEILGLSDGQNVEWRVLCVQVLAAFQKRFGKLEFDDWKVLRKELDSLEFDNCWESIGCGNAGNDPNGNATNCYGSASSKVISSTVALEHLQSSNVKQRVPSALEQLVPFKQQQYSSGTIEDFLSGFNVQMKCRLDPETGKECEMIVMEVKKESGPKEKKTNEEQEDEYEQKQEPENKFTRPKCTF